MSQSSRRTLLRMALAGALGPLIAPRGMAHAAPPEGLSLGFSLYGCPGMTLPDAVGLASDAGYRCVELPLMPNWPSEPDRLDAAARRDLVTRLQDKKLRVAAFMVHLPLAAAESDWPAQAERLKAAGRLAADLAAVADPIVETVVGGKPGEWERWRPVFVSRLKSWSTLAEDAGLTIAVKPHVGSSLNEPRLCRELIEAVDSPRVRLAYDYSHFDQRGFDLVETTRDLAPLSVFVHVKDRAPGEEKVRFVLPGQGQIDYPLLLKTLHAAGYRGAVVVEVSAQIHSQPGYSAKDAAAMSFGHLSRALVAAGITPGG